MVTTSTLDEFATIPTPSPWPTPFEEAEYRVDAAATDSASQPQPKAQLRIIRKLPDDFQAVVTEEIAVIVRTIGREDDNFVASFEKANLNASGGSPEQAMRNLQDLLMDEYEYLTENEERLGREPRRQLAILREHLRDRADGENHNK